MANRFENFFVEVEPNQSYPKNSSGADKNL